MKPTSDPCSAIPRAVFLFAAAVVPLLFALSCRTPPPANPRGGGLAGTRTKPPAPTAVMGAGAIPAERYVSFFMENNPRADRAKVSRMAVYYIEEGKKEGVNPEVAFVQMCLETGFLSFGGLVTEDMNNFCGLGSIGKGQRGNSFPDERTGVRAHVQHLKAYGSAEPPRQALVDPRYKYVNPKGKAPSVRELSGAWASDPAYGTKLEALLDRLFGQDA